MKLSEICIQRPVFTIVMSLLIIVVGVIGYYRLPVRGYPNVESAAITVTTYYDGASPSIIESQITTPIENDLVGSSGLTSMTSTSRQGMSKIVLKYKLGVDIDNAVNDVRNRLTKVSNQLPDNVDQPIIEKKDPGSMQTMVVAVTDPSMNALALTDYINRYLLTQLEQISGVASAEIYNERDYAMRISLNPSKMAANKVTVSDITDVLTQQNVNVPSGQIKSHERYYSVLAQGQLNSAKAFRNLIIRDQGGYMLRFHDVARVKVGPEDTDSAMRVNGVPAVGIGIYADSTANPIAVAAAIKKSLTKLERSMPEGMKIQVVWDATSYLKASLHTVYEDILFAIFLVIMVVVLFLGSLRSSLIPIVTIPICLIGVCFFIYVLGYSINIFTLLALVLAIGLVVDDAIVMLENIYRHIENGLPPMQAALKGSKEIGFAVVAMTITLAAVYAPIGFAAGMTGIIFREFAFTLALAVILSGFIALTLSPMMCSRLLVSPESGRGFSARYQQKLDHLFERLMIFYKKLLNRVLDLRWLVIVGLVIVAGLGYVTFQSLPNELSPKEDMSAFMVTVKPPPNASFAYINRYSQQVETMLRQFPQVKNVLMMVDPDFGGFGFVILKPWGKRKLSAQQLIKKVMLKAKNIPGVKVGAFNMSQIGGGGKYGDAVRMVISTDQSFLQLHDTVQAVVDKLQGYPGIANADQDLEMNYQQYVIHVNRNLAAATGVKVGDINNTLQTMLAGSKVTTFNWDDRDYDVLLQVPQTSLKTPDVINQLYVRSQNGKMVALSSLVRVISEVAPQQLPHSDRLRADTLTIQVAPGSSMGQTVAFLSKEMKHLLPPGYQYQFKGVAKSMLESRHTMMGTFILAIVFIYLVLAAQFESFTDPLVILLSVPLSIVGALFTLKLTSNSISIYTNIGFVTLVGLVSKHGILITEFANQLRQQGLQLREALVDAAAMRLRAILMTTAAMVIGAIPLALASGAGALGRHHIGWVIVGGLLFGSLFSLFVVPVAYSFRK